MTQREILIETRRIGSALRVTAVDTLTGTEVVFQAPAHASPPALRKLAIDKMSYVLRKK